MHKWSKKAKMGGQGKAGGRMVNPGILYIVKTMVVCLKWWGRDGVGRMGIARNSIEKAKMGGRG